MIDGITKSEVEQQLRKYMDSLRIVNTYHPASEHTGADFVRETLCSRSSVPYILIDVQKANQAHSQTVGGGGTASETSAVTANGAHSSSSGPMVDIQNTSPPSVSVVTFRWDNRHKYTSIGGSEEAPDRYTPTQQLTPDRRWRSDPPTGRNCSFFFVFFLFTPKSLYYYYFYFYYYYCYYGPHFLGGRNGLEHLPTQRGSSVLCCITDSFLSLLWGCVVLCMIYLFLVFPLSLLLLFLPQCIYPHLFFNSCTCIYSVFCLF